MSDTGGPDVRFTRGRDARRPQSFSGAVQVQRGTFPSLEWPIL
jgi:hypothetical protein